MIAACEIGPGTVQILHPGSGVAAAPLVEAVLDAGRESLALLDGRAVAVEVLWRRLFDSLLAGIGRILLIHPSWWSPARVAAVAEAARHTAGEVTTSPRYRVLHGGGTFVEIGPEFVALGDHTGVTAVQTRMATVDFVVGAVAARVAADRGQVHVDAPVGVPGAAVLGAQIARRVRAAGGTVREWGDGQLGAAAARSMVAVRTDSPGAPCAPRRSAMSAAVVSVAVIATCGVLAGHRAGRTATELVEGRVAVHIPADWAVQRVTDGPGSARVQVVSPTDPDVILHVTQSRVPSDDLAATARALRSAADAQPDGVFVDFDPGARRAGRSAVTYREMRPGHDIHWTVVVTGGLRIGIGCQNAPGPVCEQAIASAREIG